MSLASCVYYVRHAGGAVALIGLLALLFVEFGARVGADFVLGRWLEREDGGGARAPPLPPLYLALVGLTALGAVAQAAAFAHMVVRASSSIHAEMLAKMIEEGVLELLVLLAASWDEAVQLEAAVALANFALHVQHRTAPPEANSVTSRELISGHVPRASSWARVIGRIRWSCSPS